MKDRRNEAIEHRFVKAWPQQLTRARYFLKIL
jgi:hypothetical protein